MAKRTPLSSTVVFLFLFVTTAPTPSHPLSNNQYRTLVSLANSLMTRVANLRASRGDFSGSHRAQLIAKQLERWLGLGLWRSMWSVGWDFAKNYAWRDVSYTELYGAVSDLNDLLRYLAELTLTDSDAQRAAWVSGNYQKVLNTSKSIFSRLLRVFHQPGTLREVVGTVEREMVEGGLLKDFLELGSKDLKGLIQIFNDLAPQSHSTSHNWRDL